MPLVLAIEPDPRQAAALKRVVKGQVHADLVLVDSKDAALASIASEIPDLILVTALLPPRDEDDLTRHLKGLERAGHLQTLTIPLLACAPAEEQSGGSVFGKLRRKKKAAPIEGCDPQVFGDEIETYLRRAAELKAEEQVREKAFRDRAPVETLAVPEQEIGASPAADEASASEYAARETIPPAELPATAGVEEVASSACTQQAVDDVPEPPIPAETYRPVYTSMLRSTPSAASLDTERTTYFGSSIFKPVEAQPAPIARDEIAAAPVADAAPVNASSTDAESANERAAAAPITEPDFAPGFEPVGQGFSPAGGAQEQAPLSGFETGSASDEQTGFETVGQDFSPAGGAPEQASLAGFETGSASASDEPAPIVEERFAPASEEPLFSEPQPALETAPTAADDSTIAEQDFRPAPEEAEIVEQAFIPAEPLHDAPPITEPDLRSDFATAGHDFSPAVRQAPHALDESTGEGGAEEETPVAGFETVGQDFSPAGGAPEQAPFSSFETGSVSASDEPAPIVEERFAPASEEPLFSEPQPALETAPTAAHDSTIAEQDFRPAPEETEIAEQAFIPAEPLHDGPPITEPDLRSDFATVGHDFSPAVRQAPHALDESTGDGGAEGDDEATSADTQAEAGTDNERALEPWERLLREIAAQQEALNVEAARAAEEAARAAAAAAEAAKAAEEAAGVQHAVPLPCSASEGFTTTPADPAEEAARSSVLPVNVDEGVDAIPGLAPALRAPSDDTSSSHEPPLDLVEAEPGSLTRATDDLDSASAASAPRDRQAARWQKRGAEDEPPPPSKRGTSAVHDALARALGPLQAFVTRVKNRKSASALAVSRDDDRSHASTDAVRDAAAEPMVASAPTPPDLGVDLRESAAPPDFGVNLRESAAPDLGVDLRESAGLDAHPEADAQQYERVADSASNEGEDWRDVTRLIGREPAMETSDEQTVAAKPAPGGIDSLELQPEAEPAPATARKTAEPAASSPGKRAGKGEDAKKKKRKRRRVTPRERRARDFDDMLDRLDGAWVASAIAALRVDIERLRQDTLAAVPSAAPERDQETDAPNSANGKGDAQGQESPAQPQPVQDEWGFYDPGQCGIQALMARLDQNDAEKKRSAMGQLVAGHENRAVSKRAAAPARGRTSRHSERDHSRAHEDKRLAPLALWARADEEPVESEPKYALPPDDVPRLPGVSQALRLPDHVSAVRYASGCRIRRVRVAPGPKRPRDDKRQVVILSRKMLDEAT